MGRKIEYRQGIHRVKVLLKKTNKLLVMTEVPILRLLNLQLQRRYCGRLGRFGKKKIKRTRRLVVL
jgi:hypothetical protein